MVLEDFVNWMLNISGTYGYLGVFLISFLGSISLFIPIPYTVVIFVLGQSFEPFWIAVSAGIGSAIGEFSGYLIGLGGGKIISEKYARKMELLARLFNKLGPIAIFIFALTPLPDDLLFIPLGFMKYGFIKSFIPALIGKFCMNLIIAYSGRFSIDFIKNIFGIEGNLFSLLFGMVMAIVFLIIILLFMFKWDWEKYLEKYLDQNH